MALNTSFGHTTQDIHTEIPDGVTMENLQEFKDSWVAAAAESMGQLTNMHAEWLGATIYVFGSLECVMFVAHCFPQCVRWAFAEAGFA